MFRIICTSLIALFIAQQAGAQALTTQVAASGLSSPVMAKSPPGDLQRLMVVQRGGVVRLIKNGALQGTDFISLAGQVLTNDERGMLDIAFHPNYASNGYFYLRYTNTSGRTTIRRFTRSANPDIADPGSGHFIMIMESTISFHIGGSIEFGPDGYLYVAVGDSVDTGTPQNPEHPYGKILRIDVNSDDFPADPDNNYHIPPGNPFAGPEFGADEVWSLGLRNPFRMSFDRATGDMWIGDVQNIGPEEIDFQPEGVSELNFGWPCMEAFECTTLGQCTCNDSDLTLPIYDYSHKGGSCSVTGGRVYRGCAIPGLQGTYFFADFCSGDITSFRYTNGQITEFNDDRADELDPPGPATINSIVGFGEDALGELYICDMNGGEVFKIVPVNITPGACDGTPGDANGDGDVDIDDLIAVILSWGPCPGCDEDVAPHPTGDGVVNVDDVILVILNWD